MPKRKHYTLTALAEADIRAAKVWSLKRWGKDLTKHYFSDIHDVAEYIGQHHASLKKQDYSAAEIDLGVHPVREHYMVYVPVATSHVVIVAFIRQSRDVPAILQKSGYLIRRELKEILGQLAAGKFKD
jgi:plasmid stabilization system protein ParE